MHPPARLDACMRHHQSHPLARLRRTSASHQFYWATIISKDGGFTPKWDFTDDAEKGVGDAFMVGKKEGNVEPPTGKGVAN
ncbi:hypothetical protein HGRIS_006669 [Hohenbuehelia grisea]|uniref:Uncharacterized protein n=1 Tax=Hohenbuehelia grisea TaxID=104357 RepID=A0ABR3JA88_9AGAR